MSIMTHYALHDDSLTIDGRSWPASAFLVAEARAVSPLARSGTLLALCLFAPILAMVWATLVYGPGLWPLRWGGALLLGPGAIALGCWLADRWRKH
ncbi:MAG: hypothetical protein ACOCXJ_04685, partial [Planctomycetota bacterium]